MTITLSGSTGIARPLGSAGSPSDVNTSDSTTGLYFPSSNTVGISTGGTNALYIDASQNVGVGTTSPSTYGQLVLDSGSGQNGQQSWIRGSANNVAIDLDNYGTGGKSWAIAVTNNSASVGGGKLRFGVANSGQSGITGATATDIMLIDSSGNLLVGTTSGSGERLRVTNSPSDGTRTAQIVNNGNTNGNQCFGVTLGTNTNNTSSYLMIGTSAGSDRIYIYGNGNIVNTNNSYGTLSDVKLKENIVDATPKLADLMRLQVRNFNLKADSTNKQIGFIAQEFEQVFPAMVDESPDLDKNNNSLGTTTKSIKTSVLIPILVKAIQELKAEFDAYKAAHP